MHLLVAHLVLSESPQQGGVHEFCFVAFTPKLLIFEVLVNSKKLENHFDFDNIIGHTSMLEK